MDNHLNLRRKELMSNVTDKDLEIMEDWRKNYVISDKLENYLPLGDAYNHYKRFALSSGCIPLSKKAFSKTFRVIFQDLIDLNKVKVSTSSRIIFQGLKLDEAKEINGRNVNETKTLKPSP